MRNARFLLSLIPAFVLFFGLIAVVTMVTERVAGGIGIAMGLVSGVSLVFGLLLVYWSAVDWLNLRIIRRSLHEPSFFDGDVIGFSGVTRVEGEPMISPFTKTPSAAYTYVVSAQRYSARRQGRRRHVLAQGFHMLPTQIVGPSRTLALASFPGFEDELRENDQSGRFGDEGVKLIERLSAAGTPAGNDRQRHSRLLELRHTVVRDVHEDYCQSESAGSGSGLTIDEEVLPAAETVCVVGTFEAESSTLSARRSRFGPNLMVYRGSAEEVVERIGNESKFFAKAIVVLLGTGLLILGLTLLPASWTSKLPLIGSSFVSTAP